MRIRGIALKFASHEIKKDKNIVLKAVELNGYAICYADESLKDDV